MKIFVKAKSRSKMENVAKIDEFHFIVSVKEQPSDGKANVAIQRALADYFHIPRANIAIISGLSSRQKIIELKI